MLKGKHQKFSGIVSLFKNQKNHELFKEKSRTQKKQ